VDAAANAYFAPAAAAAAPAPAAPSKGALNALFDAYEKKDDAADTVGVNGTVAYLADLGVAPSDVAAFVVSEIVRSPTLGEITREGFGAGWSALGADTLDKQRRLVAGRRAALAGSAELRRAVYAHAFRLGLTESNQRSIEKDTALGFWSVLLAPPAFEWSTPRHDWLGEWIEFVGQANAKGVNKDVWEQTLKFAGETLKDESLSWWDENSAWPALIDEFVEWVKEKRGGKKAGDEEMEY